MADETPRPPASFPLTPNTNARRRGPARPARSSFGIPSPSPRSKTTNTPAQADKRSPSSQSRTPPDVIQRRQAQDGLEPLISTEYMDAPTQRLYAVGVFVALQAWKLYDASRLYTDEGDSITELWFCMKWVTIDGLFMWLLPFLRIPWLCFNRSWTLGAIALLSVIDIFISLKYHVSFSQLFVAMFKVVYDRELSISEASVKWHDVVHNTSHIQGKYTVHILPEGAAKLNPDGNCYCIGSTSPTVTIPIRINGTQPIHIQIVKLDLGTGGLETIDISQKEIKKLMKKAPREDEPGLHHLPYVVKHPGIYRLSKVRDVSELDVRVHRSEAMVVNCPKASIVTKNQRRNDLCQNDKSDLSIRVEGLAPLQVTYSREVKGRPTVFNMQRIHPDHYKSPLLSGFTSDGTLLEQGDEDLSWAQPQVLTLPLNESLSSPGDWVYEIDKVGDACGNVIDYKAFQEESESWLSRQSGLSHQIIVHKRPMALFKGCEGNPMDLPRGKAGALPLTVDGNSADAPYKVQYAFTPAQKLLDGSEHAPDPAVKTHALKTPSDLIIVKEPGLYTIRSVSSSYCSGEILEPSSCLVVTPPDPAMTMEYDEILDKCTGSSIGLTVDFTLVGAPPFDLSYRLVKDDGNAKIKTIRIDRMRHQLRFTPDVAGHYKYEFFSLDDKNYAGVKLNPENYRAEQTVKPLAGASFVDPSPKNVCIEEPVTFDIKMQGTAPLTLHYDLIHNGKRRRLSATNITEPVHKIETPNLNHGGEYSVTLIAVEDQSGCKTYLESEAKIHVRFQRPKAQFSPIEGKLAVRALEGETVRIPLRLTGEPPWFVKVRNLDSEIPGKEHAFRESNAFFEARGTGTYKIESATDAGCPGMVVENQSKFAVSWIPRPQIKIPQSSTITKKGNDLIRNEICEGDEDSVELAFTGSPPFSVEYERSYKRDSPSSVERLKNLLTAGLGVTSIRLESGQAGQYQYKFYEVTDSLYDDPRDRNLKQPIVLKQKVHPRPDTAFANPNKVYKYCLDSASGEDSSIPIHLQGLPPFFLTMNVKHQSTGKSDVVTVPNIDSNIHEFKIPSHALTLGDHMVSVLEVRDARGCVRKTPDGPTVRVAVADMPTITPTDQKNDYCVGDRIAFTIAGVPPFAVEYEWNGVLMKATSQPSQFVRVAERPGNFTVTGLQDSASDCKVDLAVPKIIHEVPSVRVSDGESVVKGIPEGDQADIHFKFFGTPPFTFTYTRSEIVKKGMKARILDSRSETTDSYTYTLFASQEGIYEVISIEDKYCMYKTGRNT